MAMDDAVPTLQKFKPTNVEEFVRVTVLYPTTFALDTVWATAKPATAQTVNAVISFFMIFSAATGRVSAGRV